MVAPRLLFFFGGRHVLVAFGSIRAAAQSMCTARKLGFNPSPC
jgi:hypothetical protein